MNGFEAPTCTTMSTAIPEFYTDNDSTVQAFIEAMDDGVKEGYVFRFGDRGFGYYTESEAAMAAASARSSADRQCAHCGLKGAAKRCARCHMAWYCNKECQVAAWRGHREHCKKLREEHAANLAAKAAGTPPCSICLEPCRRAVAMARAEDDDAPPPPAATAPPAGDEQQYWCCYECAVDMAEHGVPPPVPASVVPGLGRVGGAPLCLACRPALPDDPSLWGAATVARLTQDAAALLTRVHSWRRRNPPAPKSKGDDREMEAEEAAALSAARGALPAEQAGWAAEALALLAQALAVDAGHQPAMLARARAKELLGDADGAMEELGACVALAGEDLVVRGAAHLALGRLLKAAASDLAAAGEQLARAAECDPVGSGARALCAVGALREKNIDMDGALECYEEAIRQNPVDAVAHNLLGLMFKHKKKHDQAGAALRTAAALDPFFVKAHFDLANFLVSGSVSHTDEVGAEAAFRRVLELNPRLPQAHYSLGLLLERCGDPALAEKSYAAATELDPAHDAAWVSLGNVLRGVLEDAEGAEEAYRAAIGARDANAEAHYNLGMLLLQQAQDFLGAEVALTAAVVRDPQHANAQFNLGLCKMKPQNAAGFDLRAAEAAFARFVELAPKRAEGKQALKIVRERLELQEAASGGGEAAAADPPAEPAAGGVE